MDPLGLIVILLIAAGALIGLLGLIAWALFHVLVIVPARIGVRIGTAYARSRR